jgi:uncharacterized membrane-anchored protein YjiN (DUF445 family)
MIQARKKDDPEPDANWRDLLDRAKEGSQEARGQLYTELRRFLKSRTWSSMYHFTDQEREDLIEDTTLDVLDKLNQVNTTPQRYAFRVFQNKLSDELRHRHGERKEDQTPEIIELSTRWIERLTDAMSEEASTPADDLYERLDFIDHFMRSVKRLKQICQMLLTAIVQDRKKELYSIFAKLYPGRTKNDYYVQLHRCRQEFVAIRKELI